jgi:hypothetical protein
MQASRGAVRRDQARTWNGNAVESGPGTLWCGAARTGADGNGNAVMVRRGTAWHGKVR